MSKQTHRRALPGVQTDATRLERALQLAYVNTTSALPKRPAPRHRFDNAVRPENPTRPWEKFAEPLRDAAAAAAQIGGPCAETTEERIIDAVICFLEFALEPLQKRDVSLVSYLAAAREVPEAIDAMARAHLQPTTENLARADVETSEAEQVLRLHRGSLRRSQNYPRPRGATPMNA